MSMIKLKTKVIKHDEFIDLLNMSSDDEFDYSMYFQGYTYSFRDAIKNMSRDNYAPTEIFPGIYICEIKNVKIRQLIDRFLKIKSFRITIKNKRDLFRIEKDELSILDDNNHKEENESQTIENISPQAVHYPLNLGGGKCKGCEIYDYFSDIGIRDEELYTFFTDIDYVGDTAGVPFFDNLCKTRECYKYFRNIVENGYDVKKYGEDDIQIECINGENYAYEGKHRVCVLKRFGFDQAIPMKVYKIKAYGNRFDSSKLAVYKGDAKRMTEIKEHFYNTCKLIGIDEKSARESLYTGEDVVSFLSRSMFTFQEMRDRGIARKNSRLKSLGIRL